MIHVSQESLAKIVNQMYKDRKKKKRQRSPSPTSSSSSSSSSISSPERKTDKQEGMEAKSQAVNRALYDKFEEAVGKKYPFLKDNQEIFGSKHDLCCGAQNPTICQKYNYENCAHGANCRNAHFCILCYRYLHLHLHHAAKCQSCPTNTAVSSSIL